MHGVVVAAATGMVSNVLFAVLEKSEILGFGSARRVYRVHTFLLVVIVCAHSALPAVKSWLLLIIIIIIKKDWQCKAGRGRLTPYQSEDPSPTLPTYRG